MHDKQTYLNAVNRLNGNSDWCQNIWPQYQLPYKMYHMPGIEMHVAID